MIIERLSKAALFQSIQSAQPNTLINSPVLSELNDNEMLLMDATNRQAFIRTSKIVISNSSVIDLTGIQNMTVGDTITLPDVKESTVFKNGALLNFNEFINVGDDTYSKVFNYVMGVIGVTNLLQSECDIFIIDDILTIDITHSVVYTGKLNVKIN